MEPWDWNGARWWKFDFHTHTPASDDYGRGAQQAQLKERTPREWLLDYMHAGVDCVAITDHNSGAWIDRLKTSLEELESERPDGFRSIHLFPGVEISVTGGIHLLAIFGDDRSTSDIDTLLGSVEFPGTKGSSDAVTTKSLIEVVRAISSAGGLSIPAHVDQSNGLFQQSGTTLQQALECFDLFAIEVVDPLQAKPAQYSKSGLAWTEILGSDSHHPSGGLSQRAPGTHFTWVKMGSPSLDGMRLALLDGSLSVRRSDESGSEPNQHAPLVLESIEVSEARYMGRSQAFTVGLNPWLNAIIGGRGTGKSTIIEFLRLALRRDKELPKDLKPEFEKYARAYPDREDAGLLTSDAAIRVIYRKNGSRFRIQWSPVGDLDPIEEAIEGGWSAAEGDVTQRFPVRIYSQKQVFQLAKTPLALLGVVDDAPEVDSRSWSESWKGEEARFLSLRAKAREIQAGLAEEPRLRGELDDVKRKLAIFEEAGHADVLKTFQRRSRQQRAVDAWEDDWTEVGDRLREVARDSVPDPLDPGTFDPDASEDAELLDHASRARKRMEAIRMNLEDLSLKADDALAEWRASRGDSSWKKASDAASKAYQDLREKLAHEGAGDPAAYGELVQRRQTIEQRLKDLEDRRTEAADLQEQAEACLGRLLEIRRRLTESRRDFLDKILKDNRYVRIQVVPYGARETVESELRALLSREGGGFEKDIGDPEDGGLLGTLYAGNGTAAEIERALSALRGKVREIAFGRHDPGTLGDQRFANHLAKLQPEALDRVDLWFPEDSLDVQYSTTGNGDRFRSIQEGSPGQKTAALLAFLLSYGEEPLVLDQPEDDLDNHLIYDLIVTQLREVKRHRQIIVVTHNANIVVNGDAELVVALAPHGGETRKECDGSLQEKPVRDMICQVMEGGREAFKQRYRRIVLEGRHV